jgi:uncharacterized membrane protein YqaE (UPF0057 family)
LRYLVAILLPPVGMLVAHRPVLALLCLILMLTVIGWPIAAIWAVLIVNNYYANRRAAGLLRKTRG